MPFDVLCHYDIIKKNKQTICQNIWRSPIFDITL